MPPPPADSHPGGSTTIVSVRTVATMIVGGDECSLRAGARAVPAIPRIIFALHGIKVTDNCVANLGMALGALLASSGKNRQECLSLLRVAITLLPDRDRHCL
ncbi:MAG: hypothetical protein K6356_09610 [Chloroflexus sp.]